MVDAAAHGLLTRLYGALLTEPFFGHPAQWVGDRPARVADPIR